MTRAAVVADLRKLASSLPLMPDHAGMVHSVVMQALADAGHRVYAEVPAMINGRAGRLDLAFFHNELREWCAIEIDARRPRKRSLEKLRRFVGVRVVMLRGVEGNGEIEGVDGVIALPVRIAAKGEKDKTAVGRVARRLRERGDK